MEQIKVSDLASEFELKHTLVISELKKIGVWVPSADTPVDQDIANRIRRRLQLIVEMERESQTPTKPHAKGKKTSAAKPRRATRKTIKELGTTRGARKQAEPEPPQVAPALSVSMTPRKGKASYRTVQAEPTIPDRVEVTIDDEPVIEKVEAQLTAEALEAFQTGEEAVLPPVEMEEVAGPVAEIKEELGAETVAVSEGVSESVEGTLAEPAEEVLEAAQREQEMTPEKEELVAAAEPTKVPRGRKSVLPPPPRKLKIVKRPEKKVKPEPSIPPKGVEEEKPAAPVAPAIEAPPSPAAKVKAPAAEVQRPSEVLISETVSVKELCEKINVKSKDVLRWLMSKGVMATINQTLDKEIAEELCLAFDVIPSFVTYEESVFDEEYVADRPEDLVERAPVVTVMGHVDHGKTSVLDKIRHANVAAGEAGGITQHIGAYHVKTKGKRIVFIDTPGHEAFTRMRARGASVTDIVVLVVAADDGVMPQTREAINHARAAGVPIIVAINKIDRPDADPERVKRQLAELELTPESWGGDTIMVEVSALENTNLDQLLEMILLVAEMQELKANPKRSASGVILEARLDKGRGAVATALIQNGTLSIGDSFIAGSSLGKVRALFDHRGKGIKRVGPGSAVEILGFQGVPQAGDVMQVVEDAIKARQVVEYRQEKEKAQERAPSAKVSLDQLYAQMEAGEVKELPIVLKADAQGSVEVVAEMLTKLSTDRVKIKIIHKGVGAISETDILLSSASNAVVIGFNVRPEQNAQWTAEKEEVDVRLYTVIYEVSKEIKEAMLGLLEPTLREAYQGRAEVREIFRVPKFGSVAGCYVQDGVINRNSEVRLLRDNVVVFVGKIDSLRRFKDDVNQVRSGYECGISISNFKDLKPGDVIEAFAREEVAPELT